MNTPTPFPGLSLAGNVTFVTGGASGIGLETALTFADLGADVAVFDRDGAGANDAVARIEAIGRRALAIVGDVAFGITGTSLAVDAGIGETWDYYETPSWLAAESVP
jgi:NAD(P)-dependent dehydrogenase (short-subunit alcohol dehydrogenase family)